MMSNTTMTVHSITGSWSAGLLLRLLLNEYLQETAELLTWRPLRAAQYQS